MLIADGGGSMDPGHTSYYQVNAAWLSLKTAAQKALGIDDNEARAAIASAKAADECMYQGDFEGRIKDFKSSFQKSLDAVEAIVGPSGPFKAHDGIDQKLRGFENEWKTVSSSIFDVRSNLSKHQQMDKWVSAGAQTYKDALPTQDKALQELDGLSFSMGNACYQVALTNAWLYSQAVSGLQQVRSKGVPIQDEYKVFPNEGGRVGGTINGQWIYDYNYFWRSTQAKTWLDAFVKWANEQQSGASADWASSANRLGLELDKAENAPNNLLPYGAWPEGKSQVTGEAGNTSSVYYTGSYVGSAGEGSDSQKNGINMNRHGVG